MALKVITPSANTGYETVGVDDYRSGMIGARAADGSIVVCGSANDPSTGLKPVGILGEDRLTAALQRTDQISEETSATCGAAGADGPAVALAHNAVAANSQRVVTTATVGAVVAGTALTEGAAAGGDYTFVDAAGTIAIHSGGPAALLDSTTYSIAVSYTFSLDDDYERNFRGVNYKGAQDDTEGSKKATLWKGYGEFETDQFVTNQSYAIGDPLRVTLSGHSMGAGLLTKEASGGTVAAGPAAGALTVARVNKIPTASQPFIGIEWLLN